MNTPGGSTQGLHTVSANIPWVSCAGMWELRHASCSITMLGEASCHKQQGNLAFILKC